VDFQQIHLALQYFKPQGATSVVFSELLAADGLIRSRNGLGDRTTALGYVSVDPNSEPQRRFVHAAGVAGIAVDALEFRDTFVSIGTGSMESAGKPISTLSPPLSFALGALAAKPSPSAVVFSGSFELAYALGSFAGNNGKVVLAFWRSCIDQRFFARDFFDRYDVGFVDLDSAEFGPILGLDRDVPSAPTRRKPVSSILF
jgi:hypothetical protein